VAHARHSQEPGEFTLAPVGAIEKLLAATGWGVGRIDLFEINEAFAMVTMLAMRAHDIPHDKVNVHGGACAQGHPIGSTGSRIIVTLMHALRKPAAGAVSRPCASAAARPGRRHRDALIAGAAYLPWH
jgi:acetyl-CoA C-acetyltransferase